MFYTYSRAFFKTTDFRNSKFGLIRIFRKGSSFRKKPPERLLFKGFQFSAFDVLE